MKPHQSWNEPFLVPKVLRIFHILKNPADFGAGEVGVYEQAGLVPYLVCEAERLEGVAVLRGAAVLPDDGVVDGLARAGVPYDCGFTLVGDAHGGKLRGVYAALFKHAEHDFALAVPYFQRVVFYPAGTGEMLCKLFLADVERSALVIEDDGAGTACSLIKRKNIFFHNCVPQIYAKIGIFAGPTL